MAFRLDRHELDDLAVEQLEPLRHAWVVFDDEIQVRPHGRSSDGVESEFWHSVGLIVQPAGDELRGSGGVRLVRRLHFYPPVLPQLLLSAQICRRAPHPERVVDVLLGPKLKWAVGDADLPGTMGGLEVVALVDAPL